MESENDQIKWQELARQLSNPEGEAGLEIAEMMRQNNESMIHHTLDTLRPISGLKVLEIGPGGAAHLDYLFSKNEPEKYIGADISETMVKEARRFSRGKLFMHKVSFLHTDGNKLPVEDHAFDVVFTVNTLYFWQDPAKYAEEIKRVLKPGGQLVLAYGDKQFMETLPFTPYGFRLYDESMVEDLLLHAGYNSIEHQRYSDELNAITGIKYPRTYLITVAAT